MASDIKLDKQELLQALLDTVPGFVWIADATGCLRLINREWCNFTGLNCTCARRRAKTRSPD
ncbi:MAG: PAS domain-containing protein [Rhizobiaceae bacterium]|nr:PAS domain-containing protein [Rhizobiaceae bacterium]